jgi:hypothetical protein
MNSSWGCIRHFRISLSFLAYAGIHFLSGGMSEEEATLNLQALQVVESILLIHDTCSIAFV